MKINEIYQSIQGESSYAGCSCVFIRTSGCNLRCRWCDTTQAFEAGKHQSIAAILEAVSHFGCQLVELTGGEPLIQEDSLSLITGLLDEGYQVLLETSGSILIDRVDRRATIILDIKCPGSGMDAHMLWDNLQHIKKQDELKFVIADRADYTWAKAVLNRYPNLKEHVIHFSPVFGEMPPKQLADFILRDHLPVRLQLQIHKYIWDPSTQGV